MNIENITKDEFRNIIREVVRDIIEEKKPQKKKISSKHYSNQSNNSNQNSQMETLIGSIPFILLDKNIFNKNMDVVEFAERIGISISGGEKKKIDEIVGRIIVAIKEFQPSKISQLNHAITELKSNSKSNSKKDKNSFFEEWDKVIKNI